MSRFFGTALRHSLLFSLVFSVALSVGIQPGWADQFLDDAKDSIDACLKTDVWGTQAAEGQIFEAELKESLHYKTWSLPAGTVFRGQVSTVRHSRVFGRAGYVVLNVEEAQLPDGTRFGLDPRQYKPRNVKIHEKNALTVEKTILQQMPASALGLAVTLPLSITGAASGVAMAPVGLGVRMLTGSMFALSEKSKYKHESVPGRLAYGALDGTGLIRAMSFFQKMPEPKLQTGEMVKLHLNPKGLQELFIASSENTLAKAMPLEPTGPLVEPAHEPPPANLVKTPSKEAQTATFP